MPQLRPGAVKLLFKKKKKIPSFHPQICHSLLNQIPKIPLSDACFRRGFRFCVVSRPYLTIPILNSGIKRLHVGCFWNDWLKCLFYPLLNTSHSIPKKDFTKSFQCMGDFKLHPRAVTWLHKNARKSASPAALALEAGRCASNTMPWAFFVPASNI